VGSAKGGGIVPMDPIARLQELMEAAALPSTSLELKRRVPKNQRFDRHPPVLYRFRFVADIF